ncbi:MAG: sensor histidine kinase [Myxococcota bacterium]
MAYAGLVTALCITAVLEGVLRDDLTWPLFTTVYAVACIVLTLWRKQSPSLVVLGVFGSQFILRLVSDHYQAGWDAPWSLLILVGLPYALSRWGSSAVEIGLGASVLALFPGWLAFHGSSSRAGGAAVVLFAPAAVGLWSRVRAQRREAEQARVRARERTELAREIHDTVGHRLAVIAVQVQAARSGPLDEETAELVGIIEEQATHALAEMRTLVGGLRSPEAQVSPLPRLEDFRRLGDGCEVAVQVHIEEPLEPLEPSLVATLYRIAKEGLTNALRHAPGLTKVDIYLRSEPDSVHLEVRDDGRAGSGLAVPARDGFGLVGIGERVKLWGGHLNVGPHPEGGWRVAVSLPRTIEGNS